MPKVKSSGSESKDAWMQQFIRHLPPVGAEGFAATKTTSKAHFCSMKITEGVREYATEQGIAEDEAHNQGIEERAKAFVEKGSELYANV